MGPRIFLLGLRLKQGEAREPVNSRARLPSIFLYWRYLRVNLEYQEDHSRAIPNVLMPVLSRSGVFGHEQAYLGKFSRFCSRGAE